MPPKRLLLWLEFSMWVQGGSLGAHPEAGLEIGHLRVQSRERSRRRQARLWEGSSAQEKGSGSACTCPMDTTSLTIQGTTGSQPGMVSDTASWQWRERQKTPGSS